MSERLGDPQAIEFFHLAFLQVLQTRLDRAKYIIKGGVNLRYFFASPRFSEDIDLDAVEIEPWKLKEKVHEVLSSSATAAILRAQSIELREAGESKQTDTTQR